VITDLLPAGFEIENPRTKEIPGMDWIKDGATPAALDVRDDRIHFLWMRITINKLIIMLFVLYHQAIIKWGR